jgi:hypothetical protein
VGNVGVQPVLREGFEKLFLSPGMFILLTIRPLCTSHLSGQLCTLLLLFFPPERIKFSGGLCMRGLKFSRLEEMIIMCSQFRGPGDILRCLEYLVL